MDIYREIILENYKHPRNFGHLNNVDATSEEHNISCGDHIGIEISYGKASDQVKDIRFFGEGCAISIASASLLTEKVKGMKIDDVINMTSDDILALLEIQLTPTRLKCALLPLEVVQKTVKSGSIKRKKSV